ncbi:hypothetical protein O3Q51_06085 [Cryomorphaceae bacterium 1068]|nr:hypothetical protein [Cryomorphaceae bacterium 1068]
MKESYLQDLKDIKEIMNRSSRFISLSGLSGISAGIFALIGAYWAYVTVYDGQDYMGYRVALLSWNVIFQLLIIALVTITLGIGSGIYFTTRESKKRNEKIWDAQTKRLLINFAIPMITGGILCLILLVKGYVGVIAPLTLIFYGLALVNASKYTLPEVRSLGMLEVILGLFATYFIGYGLLFWAIGFGALHIIYGVSMHLKYKS